MLHGAYVGIAGQSEPTGPDAASRGLRRGLVSEHERLEATTMLAVRKCELLWGFVAVKTIEFSCSK